MTWILLGERWLPVALAAGAVVGSVVRAWKVLRHGSEDDDYEDDDYDEEEEL
jgi:hypothetical protein